MPKVIKIKKGLDIPLTGSVTDKVTKDTKSHLFAIVPDDFPGFKWKTAVKPGDSVKAGEPLLLSLIHI